MGNLSPGSVMDPILEDGGIVSSSSFRSMGPQERKDPDWHLLSLKSCRSTKDSFKKICC